MRQLGQGLGVVAQARHDPGQDHDEAVGAGVHNSRLSENIQLTGGPLHGALPGARGHLEDLGKELILLVVGDGPGQALTVHVGEVGRDRVGHLPDHGEHRPLGWIAHGVICRVGRPRECSRDQDRVDQLAGPARQLLGRAADDLAQDDPRVSARAHQRRPRHGVHQLVAVGRDRLPVKAVELLHHRLHGQRHVVAGIAVSHREDVQVIDLLPAGGELGVRGLDDPAKPLD